MLADGGVPIDLVLRGDSPWRGRLFGSALAMHSMHRSLTALVIYLDVAAYCIGPEQFKVVLHFVAAA